VTDLVAQDAHEPRRRAPLDLEVPVPFEPLEARVREVERNRDARHVIGREEVVAHPEVRPEGDPARRELLADLRDPRWSQGDRA
jgi:hypothetical protein